MNSRSVHTVMLSCHLFCLPCLLPPKILFFFWGGGGRFGEVFPYWWRQNFLEEVSKMYETYYESEVSNEMLEICWTGRSRRAVKRSLSYSTGLASSGRKKKAWMSSVDEDVVEGSSDEEGNPTNLSLSGNTNICVCVCVCVCVCGSSQNTLFIPDGAI